MWQNVLFCAWKLNQIEPCGNRKPCNWKKDLISPSKDFYVANPKMWRRDCKLLRSLFYSLLCFLSLHVKAFCRTNFLSKLSVNVFLSESGTEFRTHKNYSIYTIHFKLIYLHPTRTNRPEVSPFKSLVVQS